MNIARYEPGAEAEIAARAADVFRAGGVVLFPTDTLYCLGADALSTTAVDTIYAIKGRDDKKPIHALVSSVDMAAQYADIPEQGSELLAKAPGLVTLVARKKEHVTTGITRDIDTFGFRIPQHVLCEALITTFGGPLTATSANASGSVPATQSLGAILAQLGPAVSLIDLAIDGGVLPSRAPSTVVDIAHGTPTILREGAASRSLLGL
jgi:L-threonylcarbamoyladenylate synthase